MLAGTGAPDTCRRLGLGSVHEVTIETSLQVADAGAELDGEFLSGEAAAALLPLISREVAAANVAPDGTLTLVLGEATLTVRPHQMYESWQVRGPDGLLIVCSPGGEYVAVWEPAP